MYIFYAKYMLVFLFVAEMVIIILVVWVQLDMKIINGNWKAWKQALVLSMVTIK